MGWAALERWGDDVARTEPLTGGAGANDVWSVRVDGALAVARFGTRSDADLAWETQLLRHLDHEGFAVPVPIPTTDGRLGPLHRRTHEGREAVVAQEPVGHMGTAAEIAAAVLWLCSDDASFAVRHALVVDGGQTV